MSGMLYSIPVILTGYRIVQIEDEATPLAQAAKSGYYGDTVAGMLGIGVLLLLVIYFILCRKYQKRIIELQENKLHAHEDTSVKYPFLSQNECHDRNNQIAGVGVIDRSCFHFI